MAITAPPPAHASSRNAAAGPAAPTRSHRFLVVSFPDDEVRILDYNRVVRDLTGCRRTRSSPRWPDGSR